VAGSTRFTPVDEPPTVKFVWLPVAELLMHPEPAGNELLKEYWTERTFPVVVTDMRVPYAVEPGGPEGGREVVCAGQLTRLHAGRNKAVVMSAADATAGTATINVITAATPQTNLPIRQK
jgi:hypothetical protein